MHLHAQHAPNLAFRHVCCLLLAAILETMRLVLLYERYLANAIVDIDIFCGHSHCHIMITGGMMMMTMMVVVVQKCHDGTRCCTMSDRETTLVYTCQTTATCQRIKRIGDANV